MFATLAMSSASATPAPATPALVPDKTEEKKKNQKPQTLNQRYNEYMSAQPKRSEEEIKGTNNRFNLRSFLTPELLQKLERLLKIGLAKKLTVFFDFGGVLSANAHWMREKTRKKVNDEDTESVDSFNHILFEFASYLKDLGFTLYLLSYAGLATASSSLASLKKYLQKICKTDLFEGVFFVPDRQFKKRVRASFNTPACLFDDKKELVATFDSLVKEMKYPSFAECTLVFNPKDNQAVAEMVANFLSKFVSSGKKLDTFPLVQPDYKEIFQSLLDEGIVHNLALYRGQDVAFIKKDENKEEKKEEKKDEKDEKNVTSFQQLSPCVVCKTPVVMALYCISCGMNALANLSGNHDSLPEDFKHADLNKSCRACKTATGSANYCLPCGNKFNVPNK